MILNSENCRKSEVYVDGYMLPFPSSVNCANGEVSIALKGTFHPSLEYICRAKESVALRDVETGEITIVFGSIDHMYNKNGLACFRAVKKGWLSIFKFIVDRKTLKYGPESALKAA